MQDLCLKYHVLSNLTSFLIVEQRRNSTEKTSKLVNVPLARPTTKISKFSNGGKAQYNGDTSFCESFVATIGVDFKMTTVNLGSAGTARSQAWDTGQ
jgi:predicted RND superfamily exporter protein